jgi:hypothetical protein
MFVSAVDLTGEVCLDILKGDGEVIVRVAIGFDPNIELVYSVVIALSPLVGYADVPGYELVFNIVEAATDGTELRVFWDGRETSALLPEPALRGQVRDLILLCVGTAVDEASPGLVSMTTHSANLPDRALTKYHEICALFHHRGFTAGKADVWHGHHIWMMTR